MTRALLVSAILLAGCGDSVTTPTVVTETHRTDQITEADAVDALVETPTSVQTGWIVQGPTLTDVPWTDDYNRLWLWSIPNGCGHAFDLQTFDAREVNGPLALAGYRTW